MGEALRSLAHHHHRYQRRLECFLLRRCRSQPLALIKTVQLWLVAIRIQPTQFGNTGSPHCEKQTDATQNKRVTN